MFHPVMYDRDVPVESYWEASAGDPVGGCDPLDGDARCDVAIIGAGYTGLSAAYHLAGGADLDVRVLEAGVPGWGASGRNGGQCCFGGAGLGPADIAARFGEAVARQNIATQRESIELVDALSDAHAMDIDKHGHGGLCVAHRPLAVAALNKEVQTWRHFGGFECALLSADEFRERGYSGPHIHGAMHFPFGFGLHPLKYARALARLALRHGVKIHSRSPVRSWTREPGLHLLHTPNGTVRASRVLIATNGFTLDTLHPALDGCLVPALSQIVATRALTEEELEAHQWRTEDPLYDTRSLYSYFQMTPDRHLVLGGAGGLSGSVPSRESWKRFLVGRVAEMFPRWSQVDITHCWRGLVCFTRDRLTHIGEVADDPGVFYSVAYHGNGVAMATWSGRAVAGLMSGKRNAAIPTTMQQPLQRFRVPSIRKWTFYMRHARRFLASWLP